MRGADGCRRLGKRRCWAGRNDDYGGQKDDVLDGVVGETAAAEKATTPTFLGGGAGASYIIDQEGANQILIDGSAARAGIWTQTGNDLVISYGDRHLVVTNAYVGDFNLRFDDADMSMKEFTQAYMLESIYVNHDGAGADAYAGGAMTDPAVGGNAIFAGGIATTS